MFNFVLKVWFLHRRSSMFTPRYELRLLVSRSRQFQPFSGNIFPVTAVNNWCLSFSQRCLGKLPSFERCRCTGNRNLPVFQTNFVPPNVLNTYKPRYTETSLLILPDIILWIEVVSILWDPVQAFGVSHRHSSKIIRSIFYINHTRHFNMCREGERERDVQFCNSDCHELKLPVSGSTPRTDFPDL
jgi:hypothetical protein